MNDSVTAGPRARREQQQQVESRSTQLQPTGLHIQPVGRPHADALLPARDEEVVHDQDAGGVAKLKLCSFT